MKYRTGSLQNIFLLMLLTGFLSCKKSFLEIVPKGKLIATTTSDYDMSLSNNDFLTIVTGWGGGGAQVVMGDEVAAIDPYLSGAGLRTQRLFRWDDVVYEPDQDADEMTVPMQNIYAYNRIINEVMHSTGGTEQQKKSIRAEAMAGRAWTYFLLINYYARPYDAATASSDPGFPVVTEADATQTHFTRASVQEVYDFILNDLTAAIPDLPSHTTNSLRMSGPAAEGLLGKVYMFMGKFKDALPLLKSSMSGLSDATPPRGLYDYNQAFAPGGVFMPIGIFGPARPSLPDDKEVIYAKQFVNFWTFSNSELVITSQTAALYGPADLRFNYYSTDAYGGGSYPNGLLRRIGPTATQFGFTVPDLYLLTAECEARLGNLPDAVADVETLRKNRMPAADAPVPAAVASDQVPLVKFILEERIREFAVQGYRWFDMRRLSVDPVYNTTIGYTHTLFDETGTVKATYTLKPERLVLRFPRKVMDQNPGMENNP